MTRSIFLAALTITFFVPAMSANAEQRLRKNETYCLQSSGGRHGGGDPLLCRFETMAQCIASKTSNGDWCMENPEIGFRRRGY
jgi:hypothetical protein